MRAQKGGKRINEDVGGLLESKCVLLSSMQFMSFILIHNLITSLVVEFCVFKDHFKA